MALKQPVSLTLKQTNLLWLKGRARVLAGGSLSEAVDQLIDEARAGRLGAAAEPRSVVGTIDVPDEIVIASAANELRSLFTAALERTVAVHEQRRPKPAAKPSRIKK